MSEIKTTDSARKAHNAYAAEWRRKNPDKFKAQQLRYWEKRAEGTGMTAQEAKNAYRRELRRKNPEKEAEYQRRYWEKKARQLAEGVADVQTVRKS